jgi:hypothetical protein
MCINMETDTSITQKDGYGSIASSDYYIIYNIINRNKKN